MQARTGWRSGWMAGILFALAGLACVAPTAAHDRTSTPNILLVILDDVGIDQMKVFSSFGGEKADKSKEFSLLDEKQLKKETASMGEGVTFISAKKVSTATGEGYTAVYAFTDINKLKVNPDPSSAAPKMIQDAQKKHGEKEVIDFRFTKGSPAELVIVQSEPKLGKKNGEKKHKPSPTETQMMTQFFKDMKISIAVEVAGTITETNATNREGSRVTLMEMDFNKLLADPKKFEELIQNQPETLEEGKKILKGVPGVKIEMNQQVSIKFK